MITVGIDYGLKPMTFAEEINAPDPVRKTRNNKVSMVGDMMWIQKIAAQLERYAKSIPEDNDEKHAELVQELHDSMHDAYLAMEVALKKSWG